MAITFSKYIHAVIDQASDEAQKEGSASVEARHLLLAIAASGEVTTQWVLASADLDYETLRAVMQREFEESLGAAGVSLAGFDLVHARDPGARPTQLGASAKLALERGFTSGPRKKDLHPVHLLLGILQAQKGTVPRALALAGVNQAELMVRVLEVLTAEDE